MSADRPTVAAATWTSVPRWMPATDARPTRRPRSALWTTMYRTAVPGITSSASAARQKIQIAVESGMTTGTILVRAAVPRHHVRMPDERSRLRADQGDARGARPRRGHVAGGGGRPRLQHLHDPREARHQVCCAPGPGRRAEAARAG